MAVLDGFILPSHTAPVDPNPNVTDQFNKYERSAVGENPQDMSQSVFSGALVRNKPVANVIAKDGFILGDFSDDFYEQIHVIPRITDVGDLTDNVEREVEIFNAYFVPQTITNIVAEKAGGIEIIGLTPPRVVNPLESFKITLLISSEEGPAIINATFTLIFSDPLLNTQFFVIGRRIIEFPYYYSAPSREVLEWRTDVLVSNDGKEQRVRTRRLPRQSIQADFYLSPREINKAEILIYGWRTNRWAFPIWSEARPASPILAGDTVINVDPKYGDFRVGETCIIWQTSQVRQIGEIDAIDPVGNTITLLDAAERNYNRPIIAPLRVGRLISDPIKRATGWNGRGSVNFLAYDNIEFINVEPDGPYPDLYPIFEQVPDKIGGFLDDSFVSRIETIDTGSANPDVYPPWINVKIGRRYSVLMESAEQIWNFRQWLHDRSGRLKAFYMPSFENNFRINQSALITDSFSAIDDGQFDFAPERVHIGFNLADGSWVYRTVIDLAPDGSGNIAVTIDSPLNLLPSEIRIVSYVGLKRLNTDRVEFTHLANCVAEVRLSIIEIAP